MGKRGGAEVRRACRASVDDATRSGRTPRGGLRGYLSVRQAAGLSGPLCRGVCSRTPPVCRAPCEHVSLALRHLEWRMRCMATAPRVGPGKVVLQSGRQADVGYDTSVAMPCHRSAMKQAVSQGRDGGFRMERERKTVSEQTLCAMGNRAACQPTFCDVPNGPHTFPRGQRRFAPIAKLGGDISLRSRR
ncbi:hypothetical protein LX36DRAFT_413486 [Colletotrichum falcatum]|nr:hypothetical protein LX36DRAFT_413486 [Colletotrichum falcatum]